MKKNSARLLSLLLALFLLLALAPAALAEEESGEEESLIDEAYLTQWMDEYLLSQGITYDWQDFSVGFCYTPTGDSWYYDADVFMYSASLYKVPVCMLISEQVAAGEYGWTDTIQGSTVEYLASSALIRSNNDCGHVLVSYLGGSYFGKCSDRSIGYTELEASYFPREFTERSYYSARFMTQVMLTLCEGGEERFPRVIEYLLQAQPEEYLNRRLKDVYPVAQKYGAYDEGNGYNNNHIAAIIYTPSPIVVVVMTRNVGDYQNRIAEVGEFLANYSLELDEKLAAREEARLAALTPSPAPEDAPSPLPTEPPVSKAAEVSPSPVPAPIKTSAPTKTPVPTETPPEETPVPAEAPASSETPVTTEEPSGSQALPLGLYAVLGALLLMAVPVLRHALRYWRGKTPARR